jgi:hypothetical protein
MYFWDFSARDLLTAIFFMACFSMAWGPASSGVKPVKFEHQSFSRTGKAQM